VVLQAVQQEERQEVSILSVELQVELLVLGVQAVVVVVEEAVQ
jgi:hypothetical protein